MDSSTLDSLLEPISGSNMTTAILKGTTIDNPNFGIRAGQQVEILLINLNEPITTYIVTPDLAQFFTEPLASMTKHIADNEELAKRVKEFAEPLSDDNDGVSGDNETLSDDNDGVSGDNETLSDNNGGEGAGASSPSGHSNLHRGAFPAVALSSLLVMVNLFTQ